MALAESLSNPRDKSWTKQVQLKTCGETLYKGSFGKRIEWGILFSRDEEGILLIRKHAVRTASPQWWIGTFSLSNKVLTFSTQHLFFLFAILFCCLWGCVDWCKMPCEDKMEDRSKEKYSLALSLQRILITFPNWFMISLKDTKIDKSSYLSFINSTQVHREYSSINVTEYLNPKEVTWLGPKMVVKAELHFALVCFEKEDRTPNMLPSWHYSHSNTWNFLDQRPFSST